VPRDANSNEKAATAISLANLALDNVGSPAVLVDAASLGELKTLPHDNGVNTLVSAMYSVLGSSSRTLDRGIYGQVPQGMDAFRTTVFDISLKTSGTLIKKILAQLDTARSSLIVAASILIIGIGVLIVGSILLLRYVILSLTKTLDSLNSLSQGIFPEPMNI